jgi:hypothetical protein
VEASGPIPGVVEGDEPEAVTAASDIVPGETEGDECWDVEVTVPAGGIAPGKTKGEPFDEVEAEEVVSVVSIIHSGWMLCQIKLNEWSACFSNNRLTGKCRRGWTLKAALSPSFKR